MTQRPRWFFKKKCLF